MAARYAARQQFGNATRLNEQSHEAVGFRIETLWQDLRFALRQLRGSPAFHADGDSGTGAGNGSASRDRWFVDAALIKPLPYRSRPIGGVVR